MKDEVRFGKGLAWFGAVAGLAIAVGLPALLLIYGQSLGAVATTIVIVMALIAGGTLAAVSVFFGTVIPSGVE